MKENGVYKLEEQLNDLIKNADKKEDKERLKALKVLTDYFNPTQIRTSIEHYADGRYDLTIDFVGCCNRVRTESEDRDEA